MSLVPLVNPGTLDRVLADGKHTPQRARGRVVMFVVAVLVLVAAIVGGVLLLGGDDGPTTNPNGGTHVAPETPDLTFRVDKAVAIPVTTAQTPKDLADAAKAAGDSAVGVIDTIYTEAFLDPNSWNGGDYGDAWSQFTNDAATRAEAQADVLTAGSGAGDLYTTIEPEQARLQPRVLMDGAGKAVSVEAVVTFWAKGIHDDGSFTLFKSTGHYFLRHEGSGWKVVAFNVHRDDSEEPAASPTATGSGSPGPTESPS
jgi:hypothetical protein